MITYPGTLKRNVCFCLCLIYCNESQLLIKRKYEWHGTSAVEIIPIVCINEIIRYMNKYCWFPCEIKIFQVLLH